MFSTRNPALESNSDGSTMFSKHSCALVSHSDGMFTRHSASTNHTNGDQNDLIAFLSIVQKCNVGFLPITWQPALSTLGQGGSGTISQSPLSADISFAFKRFHDSYSGDSDKDFLPLMSEVLILSQPPIQKHPNIINLQGICWEVNPRTQKAVPVLVFEKAAWDLQQFMNVQEGMHMSIDDRLKVCADIGSAIIALHSYGLTFSKRNFPSRSLTRHRHNSWRHQAPKRANFQGLYRKDYSKGDGLRLFYSCQK
jgi:hypothetical protein